MIEHPLDIPITATTNSSPEVCFMTEFPKTTGPRAAKLIDGPNAASGCAVKAHDHIQEKYRSFGLERLRKLCRPHTRETRQPRHFAQPA